MKSIDNCKEAIRIECKHFCKEQDNIMIVMNDQESNMIAKFVGVSAVVG